MGKVVVADHSDITADSLRQMAINANRIKEVAQQEQTKKKFASMLRELAQAMSHTASIGGFSYRAEGFAFNDAKRGDPVVWQEMVMLDSMLDHWCKQRGFRLTYVVAANDNQVKIPVIYWSEEG